MSYKTMLENFPAPVVLDTYDCEGCGNEVKVTEMAIAGGPDKGKIEKFYLGCKCGDQILAAGVLENEKKAKINHFRKLFDQNSLVNEALKKATFDNYLPPTTELMAAKATIVEFVENFDPKNPQSLLLKGTYGTGKSHLSYATAKALLDQQNSSLFLSVPKLLTKIKESFNQGSKFSENDLLEFVSTVDVLILDDLGAEYTNKRNGDDNWVWTKLFEVVDGRSGKSTIYTTNLSSGELEQKVGSRNFSRIMDNVTVVPMHGKDYRRKAF